MKRLALVFLVLAVMFAVSCNKRDTTPDANTLSIAVFEGGYGRAFWDDLVARFKAANPEVNVKLQISPSIGTLLAPQLAVGNFPDLMAITIGPIDHGFMTAMVQNREFLDLTDFFNNTQAPDRPEGVMLKDIIIPGMLDNTTYSPYGDGHVYIAPFNAGPMGLVYNVNLFTEKGWNPPVTWDEWFEMNDMLDNRDNYVAVGNNMERRSIFTYQGIYPGYLGEILWPAIASAGGMDAIHAIENYEEGAWSNPAVRAVLENFARMGTGGYLMPGTVGLNHTQSQADMLMGRALFITNGVWFVSEMSEAPREPGFEFAITPTPTLEPGQPRYVLSSSEQITIPAAARNTELALKFLLFMYTDESVKSFARYADGSVAIAGSRDIAREELSPSVYNMLSAYDEGIFMLMSWAPIPPGLPISMEVEIFDNRITPLMTGAISADQYIQDMEALTAQIRAHIAANQQ